MNDILERLNEEQQKAVKITQGPLLIRAGAGSGKTRVIAHRIWYLVENEDVQPWNILAITFTNKAAAEMKTRIAALLDEKRASQIWISTFHSACVRILRKEMPRIGKKANFSIYDGDDQAKLVKRVLKELDLSEKNNPPAAILAQISKAKNEMVTAELYAKRANDFKQETIAKVYTRYQLALEEANAFDFDDLLMKTVHMFIAYPDILAEYQQKFCYIHVDEYQDTNHVQYVLINQLAKGHGNICVVGDDDQSIYGWRGADLRNILDFESDYPESKVIALERNYRSTQNILDAANSVVSNNTGRTDKNLWTESGAGETIDVFKAGDERAEANYISKKVMELVDEGAKYSDVAVLYRMNSQSRAIEESMVKTGIPYQIVGGTKFYQRKEIKDVMSYLRAIVNPDDNISMLRIINTPKRGIGETTVGKLSDAAQAAGLTLWQALLDEDLAELFPARQKMLLGGFAELLKNLMVFAETNDSVPVISEVLDKTCYVKELEDENTTDSLSRLENIKELVSVAESYSRRSEDQSLGSFLMDVSLLSDVDSLDDAKDLVTLMTLHSAKGLEYETVFISGLEEGIFPHVFSSDTEEGIEEERRLCYVGITRARKKLFLTYAKNRLLNGRDSYNQPSRFLSEIPEELLKHEVNNFSNAYDRYGKKHMSGGAYTPEPKDIAVFDVKAGDRVEHGKWGRGTVVSTLGSGQDMEVTVAFQGQGVKKLLVQYAPLKML